jgi:superkiller protein 3
MIFYTFFLSVPLFVIGLKQYKLAQHALIKAVEIYSGNVEAWTNLGTLYLILGDTELAHQAYAAAQRTEPSFVECWIGQVIAFK